jgi:AcrR family transcriptional regulator
MPAPLISKTEVLDRLMETFREKGYDGASLSELSAVTGLGKSSLYHHFPGGKEDMAAAVLARLDETLERALFAPMRSESSPGKKLGAMLDVLFDFYDGGKKACLLERLCVSAADKGFRGSLGRSFKTWIHAVEQLCSEEGLPRAIARARAEDCVVRIEGALVVCRGTNDTKVFSRTIRDLRKTLLLPP